MGSAGRDVVGDGCGRVGRSRRAVRSPLSTRSTSATYGPVWLLGISVNDKLTTSRRLQNGIYCPSNYQSDREPKAPRITCACLRVWLRDQRQGLQEATYCIVNSHPRPCVLSRLSERTISDMSSSAHISTSPSPTMMSHGQYPLRGRRDSSKNPRPNLSLSLAIFPLSIIYRR